MFLGLSGTETGHLLSWARRLLQKNLKIRAERRRARCSASDLHAALNETSNRKAASEEHSEMLWSELH